MFLHRGILETEAIKPKRTGETLFRLAKYFRPFWPALLLTLVLIVITTWTQVTTPQLIGQLVDCFLTPSVSGASFGFAVSTGEQTTSSAQTNCWLSSENEAQGFTEKVVKSIFTAGGYQFTTTDMTEADRLAGLGRLVMVMVGL